MVEDNYLFREYFTKSRIIEDPSGKKADIQNYQDTDYLRLCVLIF